MIDTNHEGYAGRSSAVRVPPTREAAMAALGELLAGGIVDPDDEDRCEAGMRELTDRPDVTDLMATLEASILTARAKLAAVKAYTQGA